jgi:hypothetical protein
MDCVTSGDTIVDSGDRTPRLWFVRGVWPCIRIAIFGMMPCPDLLARRRVQRRARAFVTVKTWPEDQATSKDAAQLAMLRLLSLQRQTRRGVRTRQREASAMLAPASVEPCCSACIA